MTQTKLSLQDAQRRRVIVGGSVWSVLAMTHRLFAATGTNAAGTAAPAVSTAQIRGIVEAFRLAGEPLPAETASRVLDLSERPAEQSVAELERLFAPYTLMRVQLDQYGIGKAVPGEAPLRLAELGWRTFLMRVENPARLTGTMLLVNPTSPYNPSAIAEGDLATGIHDSHVLGNDTPESVPAVPDLYADFDSGPAAWLGYRFGVATLAQQGLVGAPVEYLILQLYSQAGGSRTGFLAAYASAMITTRRTECKGFSAEFECIRASTVTLRVEDSDGLGMMVGLLIRDEAGRLYPAPQHRLEPDLTYQAQIYRADGETVRLPAGRYRIAVRRGPEYLERETELEVPSGGASVSFAIQLERWIDPPGLGWYSGEPHLHPEGQTFGIASKLGLTPETVLRQIRGEALNVGSVLIWTGGYYYEKQFLTGHVYQPSYRLPFPDLQQANNTSLVPQRAPHDQDSLARYDVEQAAFPSNRLGHLVLLRVQNHDYPGVRGVYDWPSWNLPILQWARAQGAVVGYAHCGHSMAVSLNELPNYEVPALDGIGANESFVDVAHGLVDFLAGGESTPAADLNIWYHLLNCGFALPLIGETDFPVGSGTRRAGTVRTYVQLPSRPSGDEGYSGWVDGIRAGRVYFGDGRSHVIDLQANGHPLGSGTLPLSKPGKVTLSASVAARLDETPHSPESEPYARGYSHWHIERARLGTSRKVLLEAVVNGKVVERREVLADGALRKVKIEVPVLQSSWIALRILPSVHTAALLVSVGGLPIRASRRSAQWCLDCMDVVWSKHVKRLQESERGAAEAAWQHARETYRRIAGECATD